MGRLEIREIPAVIGAVQVSLLHAPSAAGLGSLYLEHTTQSWLSDVYLIAVARAIRVLPVIVLAPPIALVWNLLSLHALVILLVPILDLDIGFEVVLDNGPMRLGSLVECFGQLCLMVLLDLGEIWLFLL